MNDYNVALEIAKKYHKDQVDKAGKPYINHLLFVSNLCTTNESKIVGLLHDLLEDTNYNKEDLYKYFTSDIVDAIECMTKRSNKTIEEYYKKIKNNVIAKEVKLNDLTNNMDLSRLDNITNKDILRKEKYQKYYNYLLDDSIDLNI